MLLSKRLYKRGCGCHSIKMDARIRECSHPIVMKGLCAVCGQDLTRLQYKNGKQHNPISAAMVSMVHSVPELLVSLEQAEQLGREDQKRLHRNRKLVLMVDLDQTLIHTTEQHYQHMSTKDIYHFQLQRGGPVLHTRLRPYCREFLQKISILYELHLFTLGSRLYAHTIAGFLDPEKKFFSHRILSRDECINKYSKTENLRHLFPCGDSMVGIIDDQEDVWKFAPNLISVKKYVFFRGTGDINARPGSRESQIRTSAINVPARAQRERDSHTCKQSHRMVHAEDKDVDQDDHLIYLQEILTRIHSEYYSRYEGYLRGDCSDIPDVRKIVPELKSRSLAGTTIVFSGLYPTNYPMERTREIFHAKALGAKISKNLVLSANDPDCTTHLIAARAGTEKVRQAQACKHLHVVNPDWLWGCLERWERVEEQLFPLKEDYTKSQRGLKRKLQDTGEDDDKDGDVASQASKESNKDSNSTELDEMASALEAALNDLYKCL